MSVVLYRKYRPKTFGDLYGQDHVTSILQSAIQNDSISHAYLFSGPRGTGKTSTARLFALAINGLSSDEYDLGLASMDIIEMDAASNRGIDEIRNLKESVAFLPTKYKKKIYIIDEVHMLSRDAFNALLKTLEEPPSHVVFILATTEAHKIPITILSRVQRHDFVLGSKDFVVDKLKNILKQEDISYDNDSIFDLIFNLTGGSFRDSETLLSKLIHSANSKALTLEQVSLSLGLVADSRLEEFWNLLQMGSSKSIFEFIAGLDIQGVNLEIFVKQFLDFLQNKMIVNFEENNKDKLRVIISITNLFLDIHKNLSHFDNTCLYLQTRLIQHIEFVTNNVNTILVPPLSQSTITSKPYSQDSIMESAKPLAVKEVNKFESQTGDKNAKSSIVASLLEMLDKENKRIKSILSGANIQLDGNICTINIEFEFNAKVINNPQNLELIKNILQKITNEDYSINVVLASGGVDSNASSTKDSTQQSNRVDSKPEGAIQKPVDKKVDNSDLVESLLI